MKREDTISGSLDWTTIFIYLAMVTLGWMNIYAATYDETMSNNIWNLAINSGRQLVFMGACALMITAIIIIDMRFYETFALLFYGILMIILLLVAFFGQERGGNRAWIGIGSFGIQPAEFAKVATALAIAKVIGSVGFRMDNLRNQVILVLLILLPMGLVLLQRDTGTALVFCVFILVFFREGMSPFLMIVGFCGGIIFILTLLVPETLYLYGSVAGLLVLLIAFGKKKFKRIAVLSVGAFLIMGVIASVDYVIHDVLKPHQQNRIRALINPEEAPLTYGYNVTQSKIAIGSGGFLGKGFLKGTQTKGDFVPAQSTDFIFCTIGEEHGWVGSLIVIAMFTLLLLRIIFIAERQKDRFARSYGYGVVSILFFHFAINIGMTVGLFPVIGIPLPFFSYGGSALIGFTAMLFILLKLDAHRGQMLMRL